MLEAASQFTLVFDGGADTDPREVSELTDQFRQRVLELEVEKVELVRDSDIPVGAKPVDAIAIGGLVITAAPAVVEAVIALVKAWLSSRPIRIAKVTIGGDSIELTQASPADQQRLVQAFVDRHTKR